MPPLSAATESLMKASQVDLRWRSSWRRESRSVSTTAGPSSRSRRSSVFARLKLKNLEPIFGSASYAASK